MRYLMLQQVQVNRITKLRMDSAIICFSCLITVKTSNSINFNKTKWDIQRVNFYNNYNLKLIQMKYPKILLYKIFNKFVNQ